jgi:proteic killer suppression protein
MIRSFRHKGISELWSRRWTNKIDDRLHAHIMHQLNALDAAGAPQDMNMPGFGFRGLRGSDPPRHAVRVVGPWCMTFEFDGADARRVGLEELHEDRRPA